MDDAAFSMIQRGRGMAAQAKMTAEQRAEQCRRMHAAKKAKALTNPPRLPDTRPGRVLKNAEVLLMTRGCSENVQRKYREQLDEPQSREKYLKFLEVCMGDWLALGDLEKVTETAMVLAKLAPVQELTKVITEEEEEEMEAEIAQMSDEDLLKLETGRMSMPASGR
jgi:hypothetical protein